MIDLETHTSVFLCEHFCWLAHVALVTQAHVGLISSQHVQRTMMILTRWLTGFGFFSSSSSCRILASCCSCFSGFPWLRSRDTCKGDNSLQVISVTSLGYALVTPAGKTQFTGNSVTSVGCILSTPAGKNSSQVTL